MTNGRPRAITEAKRRQLRAFIAEGFTLAQAARFLGCSLRTLRRELKRDPQLSREVADAELSAQLDPEKHLRRAAADNWRAAAWILERTNPQRFGRQAPRGIAPEAVAAGVRRLIEVALAEFVDRGARNGAYARLSAAADEITAAMLNPNPAALRRRGCFTPHIDAAELDAMLDEALAPNADAEPFLSSMRDKSPVESAPKSTPYQHPSTGVTPMKWPTEAAASVTKNKVPERRQN